MELLFIFDLFGTFVFAISGAFKAIKYELDLLGVIILATITGVGGGILRDLILVSVPSCGPWPVLGRPWVLSTCENCIFNCVRKIEFPLDQLFSSCR